MPECRQEMAFGLYGVCSSAGGICDRGPQRPFIPASGLQVTRACILLEAYVGTAGMLERYD